MACLFSFPQNICYTIPTTKVMQKEAPMKLDLHTHSTASDGQYTPTELVQRAKEAGLSYYALTDHDTIDGIAEAKTAARSLDVSFIPGIEISTQLEEEIHMVGLWIDENNPMLTAACDSYKQSRLQRGTRIINYLSSLGISISNEDIPSDKEGSLGRPHFAQYLIEHGYVHSTQEAFDRYLNTPAFHKATDRIKPTPQEAIQLIHAAGGKAILAHPGLLKMGKRWQESLIHSLCEQGLDGIEVYYFKHTKNQVAYYRRLALQYNLFMSCGSDFHGEAIKPDVPFGMEVEDYILK